MATILSDDKKKSNSFGDAAAQAVGPMAVGGAVAPAGMAPGATASPARIGSPQASYGATPKPTSFNAGGRPVVSMGDTSILNVGGARPAAAAAATAAPSAPAAPLDAQAASDRQAIGGFLEGASKLNDVAGAAIMDAGTAIPRAALGAYDTAVVRPVRAAGVNMAFTRPLLTPAGADPSSMTPSLDRVLGQGATTAPTQTLTPSAPAAPAGAIRPPATQADVRRLDNAGAQVPALLAPPAKPEAQIGPDGAPVMAPVLPVAPAGAIRRVGNSYSGSNVSGDVSINGRAPGGGVISMPGASFIGRAPIAGGAAAAGSVVAASGPSMAVIPDASVDSRQATANFFIDADQRSDLRRAQSTWSPRRGFDGQAIAQAQGAINTTSTNRARAAEGLVRDAGETARGAVRDAGDTARANIREQGDMARAGMVDRRQAAAGAIASADLGIRQAAAGYDIRTKARIEGAQAEVQNAKTPAARRAASEKLAALAGKAAQDNFAALESGGGTVPIDPANPMLGMRTEPKVPIIFNKATGQVIQVPGGAVRRPAPVGYIAPAAAIAQLKTNPDEADQFDEKFGIGAAARVLGN